MAIPWPNPGPKILKWENRVESLDGERQGQKAPYALAYQIIACIKNPTAGTIIKRSRSPSVNGHDALRALMAARTESDA